MEHISDVAQATITLFGHSITYNPHVIIMTWFVMGLLVIMSVLLKRRLQLLPGKVQVAGEVVFEFIKDITDATLGPEDGKKYLPFIFSLFVFILLSNWIGVVPNVFYLFGCLIALFHNVIGTESVSFLFEGITKIKVIVNPDNWYSFLLHMHEFEEPTRSINTDLALGICVFFVVHSYGLRKKGVVDYLKEYMEPVPARPPYIYFFFLNFFFYLNIIGAISDVVSHSFRLFGNIFGGFMIIAIVSYLLNYLIVPVGLLGFFGLFAGLVQAFVFTMLAVTYISKQQ